MDPFLRRFLQRAKAQFAETLDATEQIPADKSFSSTDVAAQA
jgi:hypothetical protein